MSTATVAYAGVTPAQRHAGLDQQILQVRHALYAQAREDNPLRWSGPTRDWSLINRHPQP